jgi:hypothetical protein
MLSDRAETRLQTVSARQHQKDTRVRRDEQKLPSCSGELQGYSRQKQHRGFECGQEVFELENPDPAVTICPAYGSTLQPNYSEDKTSTVIHRPGNLAIVGADLLEQKSVANNSSESESYIRAYRTELEFPILTRLLKPTPNKLNVVKDSFPTYARKAKPASAVSSMLQDAEVTYSQQPHHLENGSTGRFNFRTTLPNVLGEFSLHETVFNPLEFYTGSNFFERAKGSFDPREIHFAGQCNSITVPCEHKSRSRGHLPLSKLDLEERDLEVTSLGSQNQEDKSSVKERSTGRKFHRRVLRSTGKSFSISLPPATCRDQRPVYKPENAVKSHSSFSRHFRLPRPALRPIQNYPMQVHQAVSRSVTGAPGNVLSAEKCKPVEKYTAGNNRHISETNIEIFQQVNKHSSGDRRRANLQSMGMYQPAAKHSSGRHQSACVHDVGMYQPAAKYSSGYGRLADEVNVGMFLPVAKFSSAEHRPAENDTGIFQQEAKYSSGHLPVDDIHPTVDPVPEDVFNALLVDLQFSVGDSQLLGNPSTETCRSEVTFYEPNI